MPPPTPTPTSKKPLPKWAWIAAAVVGVLVGFLFLRRQGPDAAVEAGEAQADEQQRKGGGGGGAIPLDEGFLEALGLVPPSHDGFDFGAGGEEGAGESGSEQAPLNADIQQSQPLSSSFASTSWLDTALPGYGTVSDTSKGGSFGTPVPSTEPTNPSAPTTGSQFVKAQ